MVEVDQVVFCLYPDFEAISKAFFAQNDVKETDFITMHLERYYNAAQRILSKENYCWHDCGLQWKVVKGVMSPFQSFLAAQVDFGDAMEDEWFCVKLLLELTSEFPELVASIFDSDGDFLLIEAAEVLPRWLEPEMSKNRIFLAQGKVQIVAPNICPSAPDLQTALKLVRAGGCEASAAIQKIIFERANQPQMLHKTRLRLSEQVLKLFTSDQTLLGPAISAFYNRSPEDMRICTKMPHFNPSTESLHECTFSLTRIQFAQLVCQEFVAPANDKVNFHLESAHDPIAAELGMKLTCGLEILMQEGRETIHGRNPFSEVFSIQARVKELLGVIDTLPLNICNDPADSLDWMQVDEVGLQEQLNSAFSKASLNAEEEEELLKSWTDEYEGTRGKVDGMKREVAELDGIVEKMKSMLNSASTFEGVELDDTDTDTETESFDEKDKISCSSGNSEDEDFIEREIFEAINFDPDLLMKIVEANANMEADNTEFLRKFKEYQEKNPAPKQAESKQKGLADIDPEMLSEARKSSRPIISENSGDEYEEDESDETESDVAYGDSEQEELDEKEQDELIYGKAKEQSKREAMTEEVSEEDEEIDFEAYCRSMDAELQNALKAEFNLTDTQLKEALARGMLQAAEASRGQSSGPLETVLASLHSKLPMPPRK